MTGQTEEIFLSMPIYNQSHLKSTMSGEGEGRQGGVAGCEGGWGESLAEKNGDRLSGWPSSHIGPSHSPDHLLNGQNELDARVPPSPNNHL